MEMASTTRPIHAICSLLIVIQCCIATVIHSEKRNKVLLVSMDGFRHDYFQKAKTPKFDAMMASGARVPYVNNTFVTLTFPCHTSIVTGLYEESHGIIGNKFYDPLYKSNFSMRSLEAKWWNASEPIWINAVKAGLKVGTFFWPGSEVIHDGRTPTTYRSYNESVPFFERVETVVGWLANEDYDFTVLYFHEPDHSGHAFGPDDPRLVPIIEEMDSVLGHLVETLQKANIKDNVDVIITSDHGMTSIDLVHKAVDISDYVDSTMMEFAVPWFGTSVNIMPRPQKAQAIVEALSKVEHIHAFLKKDVPEHFHYRNNRRVMPVFVYADEGWMLSTNKTRSARINMKGTHGFDNDEMSMKPIFVAAGPSFKSGYLSPAPIKSVDIYPLLCHLLDIKPAPNNGSLERVMPLLRQAPRVSTSTQSHLSTSSQGIVTTSTTPHDGAGTTYLPSLTLILCIIGILLTKIII